MEASQPATGVAIPLWGNGNFRLLFAAQIISLTGSGVTTVGLALFAYQLTGAASATAVIGNALTLRILAFLLFSQPAGVIADRVSRKKILISADVARFALLALFPFITAVWQIYALIFAINAITAFFTPTFEASIPEVVGDEHYVKALSLSRVAVDAEAVASPALAGLLVALFGVRYVFWFDAFTYLVSALLVLLVSLPHVAKTTLPLSVRVLLSEITHGTRVLLREPSLRQALTLSFAEATAGAAAIVATVSYVRDVLGRGETAFAFVMAGLGLGSSLAAILLGRATGRYEQGVRDKAALHGRRHAWAARAHRRGCPARSHSTARRAQAFARRF
jgi:NRE family putative nickel resistance protein-like MFS transporter